MAIPAQALLSFEGRDIRTGGNVTRFQAACGPTPPTVVQDSYAKWDVINRPLMRGVTVFAGYSPAKMNVSVIFGYWDNNGSWKQDDSTANQVQMDINALDMMAGTAAHYTQGLPQIVYMWTGTDPNAKNFSNHLIPAQYQHQPFHATKPFPWVINGGITWGQRWSNDNGLPVYQEASFQLLQYLGYDSTAKSQVTSSVKGGYFRTTKSVDTALKIAAAHTTFSPLQDHHTLAERIIHTSRNDHLKLRSVNQHIRPGRKVWVPAHQGT